MIEDMPDDELEHSTETIESLLAFLRGGLAALQDQGRGEGPALRPRAAESRD